MRCRNNSKHKLLRSIENASEEDIHDILCAILRKQEEKFPNYEMLVYSIPRYDRAGRENALENLKVFMMKHCGSE